MGINSDDPKPGPESGEDRQPGEPEPSLDPATWLKLPARSSVAGKPAAGAEKPAAAAEAGALSDSFDPATWMRPARSPDEPPKPPSTPTANGGVSRRLILVGGGGAAAVLAVGGAGLWLASRHKTSPTAGGASGPAPVANGGATYVFTLPSFQGLGAALTGYGLSADASDKIVQTAAAALPPSAQGELRTELVLAAGSPPALQSLSLSQPDGSGVSVKPAGDGYRAAALAANTRIQVKIAQGQVNADSFYASAVAAGLADVLIPDFFQAFVYDFDFQREIKSGDVFEAAFEQTVNPQNEAIGAKRLIYASMTTQQKSRALYAFTEPGQKPNWFDGAGKNVQRSLMKTPVEGARISSGFGMRFHPVLGFTRMHKGTDFAVPVGTPVFASGAGKITFMGLHDGHGNYIQIEHTPTLSTGYAHLSQFGAGLAVGSAVQQGQQIALSGNSGLSSGPHLHYEVIVNGVQVDSQTYQTEEGHALSGAVLAAFLKERDRIDAERVTAV